MSENINNGKLVYDAEDIQVLLGLGRSKTYNFLSLVHKNKEPFVVRKIGKQYKIPKDSFDKWINNSY